MCRIHLSITGQNGFIGSRLFRMAVCDPCFVCREFPRELFHDPEALREYLREADAVVHLAGLSRSENGEEMYRINTGLAETLAACRSTSQTLFLGSTTHENKESFYHASKRECRRIFESSGKSCTLLMANTFGPGSRPFYNSVVSTFCFLAARDRKPEEIRDVTLELIDVTDLCRKILKAVKDDATGEVVIPHTFTIPLPELWERLRYFRTTEMPVFRNQYDLQLYEAFRSYLPF